MAVGEVAVLVTGDHRDRAADVLVGAGVFPQRPHPLRRTLLGDAAVRQVRDDVALRQLLAAAAGCGPVRARCLPAASCGPSRRARAPAQGPASAAARRAPAPQYRLPPGALARSPRPGTTGKPGAVSRGSSGQMVRPKPCLQSGLASVPFREAVGEDAAAWDMAGASAEIQSPGRRRGTIESVRIRSDPAGEALLGTACGAVRRSSGISREGTDCA